MVGVRWAVRVLGLVSTIVLARLLTPEDFGVVAVATAYIGIVEGITALPMNQALIRYRDAEPYLYDTAFSLGVVRGVLFALLMLLSAGLFGDLLDDARVPLVIAVLAVTPLLDGLKSPYYVDFQKELVFSRIAVVQVTTKAIAVAATIATALLTRSYWALVVGTLISSVIFLLFTYALKPYRPRISFAGTRKLFAFSGWLSAKSAANTLGNQGDKLLVGSVLDIEQAGYFHMGKELAQLPNQELLPPIHNALFPGFSMHGDDPERLRENARTAMAIIAALALPLGVGFALVAADLVPLLLGSKWLDIVPMIQVLAPLLALNAPFQGMIDPLLMARSQTRLVFLRALLLVTLKLVFLTAGMLWSGLQGAVLGWALVLVLSVGIHLQLVGYALQSRASILIATMGRSIASCTAMALSVFAIHAALRAAGGYGGHWASLLATMLVASVTYLGVHYMLWVRSGRPIGVESRVLQLVQGVIRKRR